MSPRSALPWLLAGLAGCAGEAEGPVRITFPVSSVGAEAEILRAQVADFEASHPRVDVALVPTPDAADERHQRYVQWLAAGVGDPDVLQLDVIWVPELAAAGFLLPLDGYDPPVERWFPAVAEAARVDGGADGGLDGALYAVPWFVDVGMLYRRVDRVPDAPESLDALAEAAASGALPHGLVLQGARYEGLVTVYLEILGAHGGQLLADGEVTVDRPEAVEALRWLRDGVRAGWIPAEALTWREEQARLAFQRGEALFMRNWPYAAPLLEEAGVPFAVSPMPGTPSGQPTAALGGAHLAINAHSDAPDAAWALIAWLSDPARVRARTVATGQLPALPALYDDPEVAAALPIDAEVARRIVAAARPRPVTPRYAELSAALQVHLHRALSGQAEPEAALRAAAVDMRRVLAGPAPPRGLDLAGGWLAVGLLAAGLLVGSAVIGRASVRAPREARLAQALVAPTVAVIAMVAVFPLLWTVWESLHAHDLRSPGHTPFVGLAWYRALLADPRFWQATGHTAGFTVASVSLELVLGVGVALGLERVRRARGLARVTVLMPWAVPTVVAALVWRFLFEGDRGLANAVLSAAGAEPIVWLGHPWLAWVPIVLADVWKTTPFVALLALAGLQGIPDDLYEAARMDGAGAASRFLHVTLPLLRPTLVVIVLFRSLDALRVFGLIYVLTGGGPGTATEPLALYTFAALLQHLRFGYGSALSVLIFALTFGLALLYLRALGRQP